MEDRFSPETPHLRAFLRKLALGAASFDIDDLLQETMNRALRYEHGYDPDRPARQWLNRIAFRVFLDARSKARREPSSVDPLVAAETVAAPRPMEGPERPDVRPLLEALDDPERSVMERTYLQSKSVAEVAAEMRMAVGTVKSHLHRARRRLAQRFDAEDWL
jgi:RNA polymerase sigma-70 factor (ECF subfamily)